MQGTSQSTRGAEAETGEPALEGIPADVAVKLARSLDRTPGAIVVLVERDLTIRWLSRSASWVTGSDPEGRRGTDSLDRIHPDDAVRLLHGLAELEAANRAGEAAPLLAGPFRYRFRRFDNDQWVIMEAQVHNLLDDPVIDGMVVISRPVSGHLDGVGHVIDLLVADAPLPTVLAACAGLVPPHMGEAAVVGLLDGSTVVGVGPGGAAERLVADERWWRDALTYGRAHAPVDFDGFPEELALAGLAAGFRTAWLSPLFDGSTSEVIGCLTVWVRLAGERTIVGDELLRQTERLASMVIGEQRRHHALDRAAITDPLTGIGNRAALRRRLDAAPGPLTVAIVDLDGFKPINDIYGHDAGDAVLEIVAQRLVAAVRDDDLVVRFGGDEFAIVLAEATPTTAETPATPATPATGPAGLARRAADAIEAPMKLPDGRTVTVGASVGQATAPRDAVISLADAELYRAKQRKQQGAAPAADGATDQPTAAPNDS
jgi:diguanylate cyclase (GGDEF)-like protein